MSHGQVVRFCLRQAFCVQEVFSFKARSTSTFAISAPAGHSIHGWIWKRKAHKELLWEGLPGRDSPRPPTVRKLEWPQRLDWQVWQQPLHPWSLLEGRETSASHLRPGVAGNSSCLVPVKPLQPQHPYQDRQVPCPGRGVSFSSPPSFSFNCSDLFEKRGRAATAGQEAGKWLLYEMGQEVGGKMGQDSWVGHRWLRLHSGVLVGNVLAPYSCWGAAKSLLSPATSAFYRQAIQGRQGGLFGGAQL